MDSRLIPERFFELSDNPHFFLVIRNPVWEIIRALPEYVAQLFARREVRRISLLDRFRYRLGGVRVARHVSIGEGTVIYPGAYIADQVVIGRRCLIGQNAVLKGPLILCDGCVVGPHSEVGRSFFFPGARAAHKNFVGESVLGADVNLGAGSETANWKLDGSEIGLWVDGERIQTGLTKFGAVIGDGSSIGGNAVFMPGALLEKGCRVGPLAVVPNQRIRSGSVIKR